MKFKLRRRFDSLIPITGLTLSLVGLVMILSSSQVLGARHYDSSYYFFLRQLIFWFLGLVVFFYCLRLPSDYLYEKRLTILIVAVVLLLLVFVPVLGPEISGARRWLKLGYLNFQPAELAKIATVVFFSGWLANRHAMMGDWQKTLLPFIGILGLIAALVVIEPDLGTAVIIVLTSVIIYFIAGSPGWQMILMFVVGLMLLLFLINSASYRAERLTSFLNMIRGESDSQDSSYHTHQALIAVGSGGLWGVGFGQSTSKYQFLPEAHTDSIFAVIAEELGFLRTIPIVAGYLLLLWRGLVVAARANSRFVQLAATGLTFLIVGQALINIGGLLGLIPFTGVPLPFISYGGSSLFVSFAALGLLTNFSREVESNNA